MAYYQFLGFNIYCVEDNPHLVSQNTSKWIATNAEKVVITAPTLRWIKKLIKEYKEKN